MKTTKKQKTLRTIVGILVAILLFFSSGLRLPFLDATADAYFREAITKSGLAYATCRIINASVSIVKDSSLQLEPAGVGISLAVGQALDPIDDMTERLSDVLVTAITSLGVQKLAYEISVSLAPPIVSIFLFVLSILSWFENDRLKSLQKTIMRFALLIIIARFCLPISSVANESIDKNFFNQQISDTSKELAVGFAEFDKLRDFSIPEIDGILGTINNSASFLKQKTIEFNNALVLTVSNMGEIVENLLKLTFLYVGIFLIQVIILPLLSFFFLLKIINTLFGI
ncbi:MAG: hypothetical protein K8S13_11860 [Desulfobacula sp.]|uniref:hypothetical protein n=1 Tax=Desulfobacula sp. TaxID=2593537 RepID=UPI0025BDBBDF|nr:hypothetical protein [Desulfobacula sp.]MCD4720536.1 hypothetical protein [Desulfobacula sp.]